MMCVCEVRECVSEVCVYHLYLLLHVFNVFSAPFIITLLPHSLSLPPSVPFFVSLSLICCPTQQQEESPILLLNSPFTDRKPPGRFWRRSEAHMVVKG